MLSIKEMVKDSAKVTFEYYRAGELWYKTEKGDFLFPVPVADAGNATFLNEDKAMLFMRYIRKYQESMKEELSINQTVLDKLDSMTPEEFKKFDDSAEDSEMAELVKHSGFIFPEE